MNAIVLSGIWGVVMMFAGLFLKSSKQIQWTAILGIIALLVVSILDYQAHTMQAQTYFGMMTIDVYTSWFSILITSCCAMYLFIFHKDIAAVGRNEAEYFALIFFVMCGVYLLASYSNLLILFLGIEILSTIHTCR